MAHNRRCKVCKSEHRTEIEQLIAAGWGARRIVAWLKETYGEEMSETPIWVHKKYHFNVKEEIKKRLALVESKEIVEEQEKQSKELFEQEVEKGITRLEMLKQEREQNYKLACELRIIFLDLIKTGEWKTIHPEIFKAMQMLYNTATSQVRYCASEEYKQLNQDSEDPFVVLMELIKTVGDESGADSEDSQSVEKS